ncbi:hypothetical protein [Rhodobacter sp. 24-YEA-8]|uniref:hypothetical protein n=1 Tax=Rhodobacter sp. 24-YEA-8 TaxID=1884310 RepID=UPI000AC81E43|nr:hypothetical protein [Rhodobacter sp. 24-YEA-8]
MPAALAVLGLTLSIGRTASSIAIMGSVEASKGGITFFGVFISGVFSRAIDLPATLPPALAARAARSIGDSYIVASELGGAQGTALIETGKATYTQTRSLLFSTSAVLILSVVVYIALASYRKPAGSPAH